MRILLYATLTLVTSPLLAQASFTSSEVQQPTFAGSPDWSAITIHVNTPAGQSGPILHNPFSATEVRHSQQVLSDGAHVDHSDTSQFYRDAQGRMRVQGTKVVVLFDPTVDATYTLRLPEKTYEQHSAGGGKNTTTIAAYGGDNHIHSPGITSPVQTAKWGEIPYGSDPVTRVDTVQLGTQVINGLQCKGTRVTVIIPAHAVGNDRDIRVVNERWYSDDLMALVRSTNDDPRFGTSTYELKDVKRNEPDPSLFRLPDGFTKSSRR